MKRKLLLSALLLAALPLRLLAQAYDFSAVAPSGQTLYYKIIDRNQRKVRIASPVSSSYTISGNLIIPEKVLSPNLTIYTVTRIIRHGSFSSGLTSVSIPKSVTLIEPGAFSDCSNLTSITVDGDNTVYDSRNDCNAVIESSTNKLVVGCKNTIIPNTVTRIEVEAFRNCTGLTVITIPNSVTSIDKFAFMGCSSLANIVFKCQYPPSVVSITTSRAMYGTLEGVPADCILTVPCGCLSHYQTVVWAQFVHKQEDCDMQYTVTALSANDTFGHVSGGGTYVIGEYVELTAIPEYGYQFDRWSDGSRLNPRTVVVNADATYTAHFVPEVGINEVDGADGITLHPNPASGRVSLRGVEPGAEVTVVDMQGRTHSKISTQNSEITLDVSLPGTYFVHIVGERQCAVRKLLVR